LEEEMLAKRREKQIHQEALKREYERQIRERGERSKREKESDRKYVKLQEMETEKVSERRVTDLLKIYDQGAVNSTVHRRVKTETEPPNPEDSSRRQELAHQSPQAYQKTPFLPSLDRIQATSDLKTANR
jgi:hypothetical protein